jgi:hypothetical protein
MSTSDVVQVAGVLINIGLLTGLIVELRTAERTRSEDVLASKMQATVEAWRDIDGQTRAADVTARVALGVGRVDGASAVSFFKNVSEARGRVGRIEIPGSQLNTEQADEDRAILEAYEAVREVLNSVDGFCISVELGAYDRVVAERVAGWRISRIFDRYFEVIGVWRVYVPDDSEPVFSSVERFVDRFLGARSRALPLSWAASNTEVTKRVVQSTPTAEG